MIKKMSSDTPKINQKENDNKINIENNFDYVFGNVDYMKIENYNFFEIIGAISICIFLILVILYFMMIIVFISSLSSSTTLKGQYLNSVTNGEMEKQNESLIITFWHLLKKTWKITFISMFISIIMVICSYYWRLSKMSKK